MIRYRSREGDMVDLICFEYYGTEAAAALVLAANPGLAARGPVLPAGVEIALPDLPPATVMPQPVRLWD